MSTEITSEDNFAVPQANSAAEEPAEPADAGQRIIGQCKWFNDEKAYGFLTSISPPGPDVFVHIRDIQASHTHNPTLYTGEYVEFGTAPNGTAADGTERLKATSVTGIQGGTLMCDHGSITFRSYSRVGFEGGGSEAN
jgi:cold shock CspA family protein